MILGGLIAFRRGYIEIPFASRTRKRERHNYFTTTAEVSLLALVSARWQRGKRDPGEKALVRASERGVAISVSEVFNSRQSTVPRTKESRTPKERERERGREQQKEAGR